MSFNSDIKAELVKLENKKSCCLKAECYGAWLFSKCFSIRESNYTSENAGVIRKMSELAAVVAGISPEVSYAISRRKKQAYRITISSEYERKALLECFGHREKEVSLKINWANIENECCYAAFLRGAFITIGTATDPEKEYHLEFSTPYKNLAEGLNILIKDIVDMKITPGITRRKSSYVVYLKDSSQIEDLLTYIGATNASMELMQIKMYKEVKNDINRKANFETANMDKTYSAAARQMAAIAIISDTIGIDNLPEELIETAKLRLENPEMTLRELAQTLNITRSAVNYRLKKILEIGQDIQKNNPVEIFKEIPND